MLDSYNANNVLTIVILLMVAKKTQESVSSNAIQLMPLIIIEYLSVLLMVANVIRLWVTENK